MVKNMLLFILGFILGGMFSALLTSAITVYIARPDYRKFINDFVAKCYSIHKQRQQEKSRTVLKLK